MDGKGYVSFTVHKKEKRKMKERKEYFFSAYNGPTVGYYTINGYTYYNGEDFRTAKRYKEYLDCGFNILQVRGVNAYSGEEWENFFFRCR